VKWAEVATTWGSFAVTYLSSRLSLLFFDFVSMGVRGEKKEGRLFPLSFARRSVRYQVPR